MMDDIRNTTNKFGNSFDTNDWEEMKSVLSSEVECDYTSFRGAKEVVTSDDYVDKRIEALEQLRTHHIITNHEIRIGNESAHCNASVMIWRRKEEEHFNIHALYTSELKPVDNKWLISAIKQEMLWTEGDLSIHSGSKVAIDERTKTVNKRL